MNALERTLQTIQHQIPDRVPVDLHNFMLTARMMQVSSFADFFRDGDAMAEGHVLAWQRFGHDVILVENGTAALAEACGVTVVYQPDSAPVATQAAIESLDDVEKLPIPDPETHPILRENLKATRRVVERIGQQVFIIGRADQGPFSLAAEIRGIDNFMMDLILEKPEKVHRLLEYCLTVVRRYALAQIAQGAHCTSIGDSPSGPDLIAPALYRQFAYPYVKRLVQDLSAQGIHLAYHICGNSTPIIGDMVRTGASIIEIDQKAGMAAAKQAARGRSTLLGPIDPSEVLAHAKPEQVLEKSREALAILAPGGEFILGPGCAMPATTPDDNIHALIEAAHRYGQFNPDGSLKTVQ